MAGQNYLANKDMLAEIHKSKISYCEFIDEEKYHQHDIIVDDLSEIFDSETQEQAKQNKADRLSSSGYKAAMELFKKKRTRNKTQDGNLQS